MTNPKVLNGNFDFIEIGTSYFQTLIEEASDDSLGLSVEPLRIY